MHCWSKPSAPSEEGFSRSLPSKLEKILRISSVMESVWPRVLAIFAGYANTKVLSSIFLQKGSYSAFVELHSDIDTKDKLVKDNVSEKQSGAQESSSRMPLLLSEKVKCSKALVECEGESIDLSGDVGSVGRIVISDDSSKNPEMFLDLKGTIYKTTIVPSRTFCVVSFGQSEAKIEAIMNDYIQLKPQSNIYENETMVEGTLDGFSFDSDDEVDKTTVKADQHEAAEEQPDGKTKRKPDKTSGLTRKKGKPAGGKLPKKVNKKPQVSKRGKTKK